MPHLIDLSTAKADRVQMFYDLLYTLIAYTDQELGEDAMHVSIRCVLDSIEEEVADELRARGIDPNANPVEWRWVQPDRDEEPVLNLPRTLTDDDSDTQPTTPVPAVFANVFEHRDLESELDTPWATIDEIDDDEADDADGDLAEPAS